MVITLAPVSVESYNGGTRILWDWSVETNDGKNLSGMEPGVTAAKFYILVACFRFLFTKIGIG